MMVTLTASSEGGKVQTCLCLSPAVFPSHGWFASHQHCSGMFHWSLLSLRETCLVYSKQLRSWCHPQNLCNSGWVKKEDKVLGTRKVCVAVPSLQTRMCLKILVVILGKSRLHFLTFAIQPPPSESFLPCLGAVCWSFSPVFRKLPVREENELVCSIMVWASHILIPLRLHALCRTHWQTQWSCYGSRHLNHLRPLPKISVCYCFQQELLLLRRKWDKCVWLNFSGHLGFQSCLPSGLFHAGWLYTEGPFSIS